MKKIILGSLFIASFLVAEVITLSPYIGEIDYDSSSSKSEKDSGELRGIYASVGDLSYLIEGGLSYMETSYKNASMKKRNQSVKTLDQYDLSLMYSKYYENFMIKGGLHYISTNDDQLNDGIILLAAIGNSKDIGIGKYSRGVELYHSYYSDGHDENYVAKSISILQVTPYFSFFTTINADNKNSIDLRLNHIITSSYVTKNYTSYEISDTYYYKSFFTTIKAYFGDMRTGVKNGGMTVFNTLDLQKSGYGIKLGYYIKKNADLSISYTQNNYREFEAVEDGVNSVVVANFTYRFES